MATYVCSLCGFIYEEALGIPESGIAAGTTWEELPDDWVCPLCGAGKDAFEKQEEVTEAALAKAPVPAPEAAGVKSEVEAGTVNSLTPLELSALCTNLARGCEKQYKFEEEALFRELGDYFAGLAEPALEPSYEKLAAMVMADLDGAFPEAYDAANNPRDRGALRALVWSEKVTKIIKSALARYEKQGEALVAETSVYVCSICGFIYLGENLPDICPVCKVPNWKFEKVEARQ